MQKFANEKLNEVNVDEIEFFHRIRNQLYHEGNGITIERQKVITYGDVAKQLFLNLFNYSIPVTIDENNPKIRPLSSSVLKEMISAQIKEEEEIKITKKEVEEINQRRKKQKNKNNKSSNLDITRNFISWETL